MDPMPGTDTATVRAGRHVLGDLEGSVDFPNTFVVDAENGQILGLDAVHVRSVRDGEGTTLHVVMTLRGNELAVLRHAGEVSWKLTVANGSVGVKSIWAKIGEIV
jgi:hypothetical protein